MGGLGHPLQLLTVAGLLLMGAAAGSIGSSTLPTAAAAPSLSCGSVAAADIGACVSRLFTDPASPYAPTHVHTADDRRPASEARTTTAAVAAVGAGSWRVVADARVNGTRVNAIHVSVTRLGKVLLTAGSGNDRGGFDAGTFVTFVWDPRTGVLTSVPTPKDLFCSGHVHLNDGRLLFFGGTAGYAGSGPGWTGQRTAYVFDDVTNRYAAVASMNRARWYPSGPVNSAGNPVVVGGLDHLSHLNDRNEIFSQTTRKWQLLPGSRAFPMYAHLQLRTNGTFFFTGGHVFGNVGLSPGIWNWTDNRYQPVDGLVRAECRDQAASVLLYPAQAQRSLLIGGGCSSAVTTTTTTAIASLNASRPRYVTGPYLPFAAMHVCALNLPDKSVFVSGGGNHNTHPVLRAAVLRQGATAWEPVAPPTVARMYHSTCVLAPDGSVLTLGSSVGTEVETRIESYSPWYMSEPRPAITGLSPTLAHGRSYSVSYVGRSPVREAMLIRLSSTTHSADPNQRAVRLAVTPVGTGRVTVQVDSQRGNLPPGPYLAYLLDSRGVPSRGLVVRVG